MKDYAKFCSKVEELEDCNLGVCPEPTASPNVIDSKYNTMDCQRCPNERPLSFLQLLRGLSRYLSFEFVTSEAVKALGVFSCNIIDGPQRKYLKKSLNHFVFFCF